MAKANITSPERRTADAILGELSDIADRLAGVRRSLELFAHNSNADGDGLYMLAEVVQHANERICECCGEVSAYTNGGAA